MKFHNLATRHLAEPTLYVRNETTLVHVHVYQIILVIPTLNVVLSVLWIVTAQQVVLVAITNALTHVQGYVVKMQFVKSLTTIQIVIASMTI